MTIQELTELLYTDTSPSSGAPSEHMTDRQWQEKFRLMRSIVRPSSHSRIMNQYSREPVYWQEEPKETYAGITNWQAYAMFINDTLKQLRHGEICYAYVCW